MMVSICALVVFLGNTLRFLYLTSGGAEKATEIVTIITSVAITRRGLFMCCFQLWIEFIKAGYIFLIFF
jgi:hypothetical protein